MLGRRVLILAPHPDDEVVGCAATIGRAKAAGAEIAVLFLTTGVPERLLLWPWQRRGHAERVARRRREAQAAAALIGYSIAGFADTPSRCLKGALTAARERVAGALRAMRADSLWVPAYEGGHQDHDAANAIGASLAGRVRVIEFAEYNLAGGAVRLNAFPGASGGEHEIALDTGERTLKRKAIAIYRSERGNLSFVGRERECLRPLVRHDYSRPPHPGRLFTERFHWVPFRHPRIDFTPPGEVTRALSEFLGSSVSRR